MKITPSNAHLIAAAPELYEALQFFQDKFLELNPSNYDHEQVCELNANMCEVYILVDDVLKKARGE